MLQKVGIELVVVEATGRHHRALHQSLHACSLPVAVPPPLKSFLPAAVRLRPSLVVAQTAAPCPDLPSAGSSVAVSVIITRPPTSSTTVVSSVTPADCSAQGFGKSARSAARTRNPAARHEKAPRFVTRYRSALRTWEPLAKKSLAAKHPTPPPKKSRAGGESSATLHIASPRKSASSNR